MMHCNNWSQCSYHNFTVFPLLFFSSLLLHRFIKIRKTRPIGYTVTTVQCARSKFERSIKTIEFGTSEYKFIYLFRFRFRFENQPTHFYVFLIAGHVINRWCNATISTRSTKNTATHFIALLCIQSNLGLGDIMLNFLYRHHGKQLPQRCINGGASYCQLVRFDFDGICFHLFFSRFFHAYFRYHIM